MINSGNIFCLLLFTGLGVPLTYPIATCKASYQQISHPSVRLCKHAYDRILSTFWAYDKPGAGINVPADASFQLYYPAEVDQVSLIVSLKHNKPGYHYTKMKLEIKRKGEEWKVPPGVKMITTEQQDIDSITNIITLPAEQKIIMITFDMVTEVEEVRVNVLDTEYGNKNGILNEILIQKQNDDTSPSSTGNGWTILKSLGYKLFFPASSAEGAAAACTAGGGQLADVTSQAVNGLIKQLANEIMWDVLLGGKRVDSKYHLADGVISAYSNFPKNVYSDGDCVVLLKSNGLWYTMECSKPVLAYVCQKDALEVTGRTYSFNFATLRNRI